jgi:hypothetical protein
MFPNLLFSDYVLDFVTSAERRQKRQKAEKFRNDAVHNLYFTEYNYGEKTEKREMGSA